ncbi:MAG: glycosyltransferase [Prevotellaceae bacterium]|jgi:glycosyltransferase involved in cell wall biosynthesis|nr:glycosyltransferase [Prevotellaceae bacterium]
MNVFLSYFSITEWLVLLAVAVFFTAEVVYWGRLYAQGRVCKTPPLTPLPEEEGELPGVSVILSARNEYDWLRQNLPLLLEQDYPKFEVVVVNDCSEDESELLLAAFREKYPQLVFRTIEKDEVFSHSRKMALGIGIKAARYDLFLFTDAGCRPSSDRWIRSMQRYFTDTKELVIGYTRLANAARWIRVDYFMQALHYMGKAMRGRAYMGESSNLAYRRETFFGNRGFDVRVSDHLREDIVFVRKVATRTNVAVAVGEDATTVDRLRYTSKRWWRRRVEELQSFRLCDNGPYYPAIAESLCRLSFFVSAGCTGVIFAGHSVILPVLAGLVCIRFMGIMLLCRRRQRLLGEKGLLAMCGVWDVVGVFFHFYFLLSAVFRRNRVRRR